MLATLAEAPLDDPRLIYEPKYDGMRALVEIDPPKGPHPARIVIWSRLGNAKTAQFPELTAELTGFASGLDAPLVVDGEIVAVDARGRPLGFQHLQCRLHVTGARAIAEGARGNPTVFVAFDLLRDGEDDLRSLPLTERRRRLERRFVKTGSRALRLAPSQQGSGGRLLRRVENERLEGLIAKTASSAYETGRRSPAWRKIKLLHRQELVVGGWTDPRASRRHFGALLIGYYEGSALRFAGQVGSGFTDQELTRVAALLRPLRTDRCSFDPVPVATGYHWVEPSLVAEVKFTEWTAEGRLRHPIYLGLRTDKDPRDIVREQAPAREATGAEQPRRGRQAVSPRRVARASAASARGFNAGTEKRHDARLRLSAQERADSDNVIAQLAALERAGRDGTILLPDGSRLDVTNLRKVFWPAQKITKGELLRYYVRVSPYLLPAVADRVLVMKRLPHGVTGKHFYQQRSLIQPPPGVRVETLPAGLDPIDDAPAQRFVGGSLLTLLYMTQLAAISQDPWFSRVSTPLDVDHVAIDLDPGEGVAFERVLEVARAVREELDRLAVPGVPKTSGSRGLHIYIPMPPHTSYESGLLFARIVATLVASKYPKVATIERMVRRRPAGTVYVDYLQNILGKTLATAYSARASDYAGVSTPLTWKEVEDGVDPGEFTIRTVPERLDRVGDLWARLRTGPAADLRAVLSRV